jgi:hypothetical protein
MFDILQEGLCPNLKQKRVTSESNGIPDCSVFWLLDMRFFVLLDFYEGSTFQDNKMILERVEMRLISCKLEFIREIEDVLFIGGLKVFILFLASLLF